MLARKFVWVVQNVFSFPVFLGVALAAGGFWGLHWNGVPVGRIVTEADTWWHLAVGESILASGRWPTSDTYSFTVFGHPWIAYEWLGEIVIALAARWGGLQGMAILLTGLTAVFLVLLYYYAYLRSRSVKAAGLACILLLPMVSAFCTLRPQLLGFVLVLAMLIGIELFHQGYRRALWILPPLLLLSVNTHGTFTLGVFVLAVYGLCRLRGFRLGRLRASALTISQRRELAVIFLLCVLALPLTPYGTQLAAQPLEVAFLHPMVSLVVVEWHPLALSDPMGQMFLVLVVLFLVAQLFAPAEYRLHEILLLVFSVVASCLHVRFVLFFVTIFAPILAVTLARWVPSFESAKDRPVLNAALMALAVTAVIAPFPSSAQLQRVVARQFPQGAIEHIHRHPISEGMLNEYNWGGYLIWMLRPKHKVFIDGRAYIYDHSGVLSDFIAIGSVTPNVRFLLRKYGIQACLLHRGAALANYLAALPDWEIAYEDELCVLLVHRRAPQRSNINLSR